MTGPDPVGREVVRGYVEIADLDVRCAFPMRPDVRAASDTCQARATSGVKVPPNGVVYYRCVEHRGMVDPVNFAPVVARVVRRTR